MTRAKPIRGITGHRKIGWNGSNNFASQPKHPVQPAVLIVTELDNETSLNRVYRLVSVWRGCCFVNDAAIDTPLLYGLVWFW